MAAAAALCFLLFGTRLVGSQRVGGLRLTSNDLAEGGAASADRGEPPVKSISLLGERHSGTNWITQHLESCFGSQLVVKPSYSRFKHWFQYDYPKVGPRSTVVVAMFRDPYDWVQAMHERPHHAHLHRDLPWKKFVETPWTGPRREGDQKMIEEAGGLKEAIAAAGTTCVSNFTWNEVVPCSFEDLAWVDGYARYTYELKHDGSGEAYASVVDLRRDKILNFLSVPGMKGVRSFHKYRYEDLERRGTAALLRELEAATGREAECDPHPGTGVIRHKVVYADYIDWMNEHVDWAVEAMVGYTRREP